MQIALGGRLRASRHNLEGLVPDSRHVESNEIQDVQVFRVCIAYHAALSSKPDRISRVDYSRYLMQRALTRYKVYQLELVIDKLRRKRVYTSADCHTLAPDGSVRIPGCRLLKVHRHAARPYIKEGHLKYVGPDMI